MRSLPCNKVAVLYVQNMKDRNGKVAVVTGAGSGIGRSLAIQLAQQGCVVSIADIDEATLTQTRNVIDEALQPAAK